MQLVPSFAWKPVAGVDKYEFQISADAGMNSPVLGTGKDDFFTKNTRATLPETVPNGTYWWRVRATNAAGTASKWTQPRSFRKLWNFQPVIQSPASGAALTFPAHPVVLSWSGIPGAAHYLVSAASDPALGSLVLRYQNQDDPKGPPNVAATSAAITGALAPGSYYWSVTPVDAEGNRGVPTPVASFSWLWPSATTPALSDLNSAPEVFDPHFSWTPVPGAARYEVEVNSSSDFAPGSKVCCTGTTIATSLTPTTVFEDDVYYWRVRAIDPDGNAGVWNLGQTFSKTFDKVAAPGMTTPSVKNLHMRDNVSDPGVDQDSGTAGYQTKVPVVSWNPVPGAASYDVEVTPFTGAVCDWTASQNHWHVKTAVTAWTPLGSHWNNVKPYLDAHAVANELVTLDTGPYCVRVRARSDRASTGEVYGDYTYLTDGSGNSEGPAFEFTGYPDGAPCTPSCNTGYLGASDYGLPATGTSVGTTPYFTWKPLSRKAWVTLKNGSNADALTLTALQEASWGNSLEVTVHDDTGDPSLDDLVISNGTSCATETYQYPDNDLDDLVTQITGNSLCVTATRPGASPPSGPLAYVSNVNFNPGITSYFVLVSKDASFSNIVDYAFTQVPAYAPRTSLSPTTFPDETTLYYWAVLPASTTTGGVAAGNPFSAAPPNFQKQSTPPSLVSPSSVQAFLDQPTFRWTPVLGARRYRIQVAADPTFGNPLDDVVTDSTSYSSDTTYPADTVLYWRVRADDENLTGLNWSATGTFQKKLAAPVPSASNPRQGDTLPVWGWSPVQGAASYDLSIDQPNGQHRDFTDFRTPTSSFLKMTGTGVWHWRVRAEFPKDSSGSVPGPYSAMQTFTRTIGEPANARTDSAKDHVLLSWDPRLGVKTYKLQIASTPDFSRVVENVSTDNTSYAPTLTQYGYNSASILYWRVAGVDEDGNQGDWTQVQQIRTQPRMRILVSGLARHKKMGTVRVTVMTAQGKKLSGARVRVTGPGVKSKPKKSNKRGTVSFKVKPKKKGKLLVTVTRAGYQPAYGSLKVR
ncbi:MAG TPA: hypothetical protein VH297_10365 [Gaiellaceae bacterium]